MQLKLLFKNEIIIEVVVEPEWKWKLCIITTYIIKLILCGVWCGIS